MAQCRNAAFQNGFWGPLGVSTAPAPAPTWERGRWCCQTCFSPNFTQDSIYSFHSPQTEHPSHRAVLQPWKWQDVLHWHISPTALNSPGNNPRNTCTRGNGRHRRASPTGALCNPSTEVSAAGGSSSCFQILHIHSQNQAQALKAMGRAHSRFCLLCPGALWFVAASATRGISCCTKR